MADDQIMRIGLGAKVYELDVSDLDGREQGTIERMREQYGRGTGTLYGCLLIAKLRAGEKVTEDDVLKIKAADLVQSEAEDDAGPPARGRAGKSGG